MTLSRAALFAGLVAAVQAALVVGMYRFGFAGSIGLMLLFLASLGACYGVLRRVERWSSDGPRRHSLYFFLALVLAGAVQLAAVVVALGIAFNIWGT